MNTRFLFLAAIIGATSLSAVTSNADRSHQIKRWADQEGVKPLEEIMEMNRKRFDGRIIDMEVEEEHGRIIYEVEYIDHEGVIREVHIDARTGEWLKEEIED
ncbi:MAG: PepSY domain-containing protein [Pseudomonadales bacterium]|nr:PepSY domain-containing protein [Pseudomonadales bacterium]